MEARTKSPGFAESMICFSFLLNIYIYIYLSICISLFTYVAIYITIFIYITIYIYIYICSYTYTYIYTYIYIYIVVYLYSELKLFCIFSVFSSHVHNGHSNSTSSLLPKGSVAVGALIIALCRPFRIAWDPSTHGNLW